MIKSLLTFIVLVIIAAGSCAASDKEVQRIGNGDGHIHIVPALSRPSLKNGEQLTVSALINASAGVREVTADFGGIETVQLQPSLKVNNLGEGMWSVDWVGHNLEEKVYNLTLRVTDRNGRQFEDRSLQFSDPAAGLTNAGTTNYANGGMRRVAALDFNGSQGEGEFRSAVIDPAHGYAYFGTWTTGAHIVKVALNGNGAPTRVAGLALGPGEDGLESAAIDTAAGFAYFCSHTDTDVPSRIIKIALGAGDAAPTKVGTLILNPGENNIHCAAIDTANGYLYVCSSHDQGHFTKISLNGSGIPTRVAGIVLNPDELYPRSIVLDTVHGYAYIGLRGNPGKIVKVALGAGNAAPTRVAALTLDPGDSDLNSAVIDPVAGYAYFGTDTVPGHIVKIALGGGNAPPARVGALTLNPGEGSLHCSLIDAANNVAWFGTSPQSGTPASVIKIGLNGTDVPVRLGALQMNPGDESFDCGAIDTAAGYAYFGSFMGNGRVTKVALTQRAVVKATKMTLAENADLVSARLYSHAANGNVRLAIYNDASPKQLLWESGAVANTILNDVVNIPISSGTPATLSLTPGSYWLAWQIDSLRDVPSYTSGNAGDGFFLAQDFGSFPASLENSAITSTAERWTEFIVYHVPGSAAGGNAPPVINSTPTATPNPGNAGQQIMLSVAADDPEFDLLSYSWDFGDGTTGAGASSLHVYMAEGTYTATVTISDGNGGTTSGTVSVHVISPAVGGGPDSDGDGFSDSFEIASGSDPHDPTSTPMNNDRATQPRDLTLSKVGIKLGFAKPGNDSISFSGSLPIAAGFSASGQKVITDVGGVVRAFTLDAKGSAKSGGDSIKLAFKSKKGVVADQTGKFAVKMSKGSFTTSLSDEGLTGDSDVKSQPREVVFTVLFDGMIFQVHKTVSYTAKAGKTGSAK